MDKKKKEQIDKLNELYHLMIAKKRENNIGDKYPLLKSLNTNEISILRIIEQGEDVIIKDIVDDINIPKSTLTSMIDRLENRNLIRRAISKKDRRSYKLELTSDGELVNKEHKDFEDEIYGKIINSLDSYEEREEFLKLIEKIVRSL